MRARIQKGSQPGEEARGHLGWVVKQALFGAVFLALFLVLDGSSTASQAWEGAPPCYLPVGIAVALLLCGGLRYVPLLFLSSIVAAAVNYHRPLFSWCGIPGATLSYAGYIIGAEVLRRRWPIDRKLSSLRDVARFVVVFLTAEISGAAVGTLTLLGDGYIQRPRIIRTAINWAASDAIAIVTFTPFLLVYVAPRVRSWLRSEPGPSWWRECSPGELLGMVAQSVSLFLVIWFVFGLSQTIPYQPLYLLFIPVIWAAVRRGIPGAAFTTPAITFGLTFAAWLLKAPHGSLPRLQLAMLTVGLTGLCLGAVVSERQKAEAELRRSEAGLKEAQRVARLGSWTMDPASGHVTWTEELYRMLGFDPSLPAPDYSQQEEIFTPESWKRLGTSLAETLRAGVPYEIELETKREGRENGWILARGEPQRNQQGAVIGLCGIAQDITERKRWEAELQSKTAFLEAQANSSIDGVLVVNERGQKLLQNQRLIDLFHIPEEVLRSQDDGSMLAHVVSLVKDPDTFLARVHSLYEHREETSRDEVELTNGTILDRYSSPVVGKDGKYYGRIWAFRDITERKSAEQELVKARELAEAANRAKSEFLANMSHEIRTPINGILGMADLLLDTGLTAEQREDLQILKSSGDSLLGVINDILDFSKIEAGKLQLDLIDFNLHDLISETVRGLALRAHQKGLEIAYFIEGDVPVTVAGDPGRLRQTLVNLLANAVKFTERGEVVLSVLTVSRSEHEWMLHFSIADTGIGIPQEKHSEIFEAFAQADSSTTRSYGGSGLGLAICARLVGMMGGRIWVNSAPGQGSTFHFTAAFGVSCGTQAAIVPCIQSDLLHVPVIIVDDNATNRMILSEMTESWGMAVVTAPDGESALAAMRQAYSGGEGLRLAIIDGHMPGMDGFELAERIRQDPRLAGAMIMLLTSTDQSGDAARCRRLGIAAYLLKPIRKSELLSAILSTLGGQEPTSSRPSPRTNPVHRERGLRILLVEDNPVNQTVGLRMLEKMGHHAALAKNGKEALARIAEEEFELVLMDVQMPEMDGLTATRHIRSSEKVNGGHLPIIAMTARAMRGDREECLAAGMDGYVSKPIARGELESALRKYSDGSGNGQLDRKAAPPVAPAPARDIWDIHTFLEKLGGDENLLQEIMSIFLDETPKMIARLQQAIQAGDAGLLETTAHSLKGELGYFGSAATHQARELERLGRERSLGEAAEVLISFVDEVNSLMSLIRREMRRKGAHAG